MHEAAAQGRALQLQQLIEGGAAVNHVAIDSITPLHEACIQGQTQCVRLLLEAGAQVRRCQTLMASPFSAELTLVLDRYQGFVSSRWMRVTSMEARPCAMPVQQVALNVSSCCWSTEQQLILHCLPSHRFTRLVWEVRLVTCNITKKCLVMYHYQEASCFFLSFALPNLFPNSVHTVSM